MHGSAQWSSGSQPVKVASGRRPAVSARLECRGDEIGPASGKGQGPVHVCSLEEKSGRRHDGKPDAEPVLEDITMGDSSCEIEESDDETGSSRPQERMHELLLQRRTQRGDDEEQRAAPWQRLRR
jgi:hypothetical protein